MSETQEISPENPGDQFERCEQCNAPVDRDQRYCVNCGAHRRHVPDPAAKYMSANTAHRGTRTATGVVVGRPVRRRSLADLGLLGALALALIPVAAAVGVVIGRSSNNQDSRLFRAIENQHAQVSTTLAPSSATAASPGANVTASSAKTKSAAKKKSAKKSKAASKTTSTSNGTASKITGAKVTASQQSQGSAEAKKIQNSTGQSYVQGANNLPSSVVVGQ